LKKKETIISAIGAFIAVLAAGFFSNIILGIVSGSPIIIASTAASAMLMFAIPHSAFSRPYNLILGHTVSAIVGVSCYKFIPNELLSTSLAVPLALIFMHLLKCMHPPGGATAVTAIIAGSMVHQLGYEFVIMPIFFNSLILLTVAMAVATFRETNPFLTP
jgi:CBS domain-containing membrane protein